MFGSDTVTLILLLGHRSVTVVRLLNLDVVRRPWMQILCKLLIYMKLQTKRVAVGYGKFITFIGYEPRGSGFNSCQPHQTINLRTAMF